MPSFRRERLLSQSRIDRRNRVRTLNERFSSVGHCICPPFPRLWDGVMNAGPWNAPRMGLAGGRWNRAPILPAPCSIPIPIGQAFAPRRAQTVNLSSGRNTDTGQNGMQHAAKWVGDSKLPAALGLRSQIC